MHTPNGVRFADRRRTVAGPAELGLERALSPRTRRVVAASWSEAQVLRRAHPADRICCVPNGLPVGDPLPLGGAVVSIGRHEYQKDPMMAARLMVTVCKLRPGTEAILLGRGPLTPRVEQFVKDSGADIQLVTGSSERALAEAAVVVLSSRWEGLPYVALEAMRAQRAVVATDVVGNGDAVVHGETGLLFSPNGPGAAAQVAALLDDRKTTGAMGVAGRRRFLDLFTSDRTARQTMRVYEDVVQ